MSTSEPDIGDAPFPGCEFWQGGEPNLPDAVQTGHMEISADQFDGLRRQDEGMGSSGPWWGRSHHLTPGDVHTKHYDEPNDRQYDS
jgi:hypothetical protein